MKRITASIVLAAFLHEQILLAHDPYLNLHNPPVPEVSVDTLSSETQEASSDSDQATTQDFLAGTDASPISASEVEIDTGNLGVVNVDDIEPLPDSNFITPSSILLEGGPAGQEIDSELLNSPPDDSLSDEAVEIEEGLVSPEDITLIGNPVEAEEDRASSSAGVASVSAAEPTIEPPTLDPVPHHVNTSFLTFSGTKPPGTTIWINGRRIDTWTPNPYPSPSPLPDAHPPKKGSWSYTIKLPDLKADGDTQTLSIITRDRSGSESEAVVVEVTLDKIRPYLFAAASRTGDVPHTGFRLEGMALDKHGIEAVEVSIYIPRMGWTVRGEAAVFDSPSFWHFDVSQDRLLPGEEFYLYVRATDHAGNVSGKRLRLMTTYPVPTDGTEFFFKGGRLVRERTPEGDWVFYGTDHRTERYQYKDESEIHYLQGPANAIEIYDQRGRLVETIERPEPTSLDEDNALKVTFGSGLDGFYVNGIPVELRTQTGIRITDFTLNDAYEVENAFVVYPEETLDVIRRGALIRRIHPDGSITDFTPKGFRVREISLDHTQSYAFVKTSQTEVLSTRIFSEDGSYSLYDERGLLREARSRKDQFLYDRLDAADSYTIHLNRGRSSTPDEKTLVEAQYTLIGDPIRVKLKDGTEISFKEGRVSEVKDAAGSPMATYSYRETEGILKGLQVTRQGTDFLYDASGFLTTVSTESGTITRTREAPGSELTDDQVIELLLETAGGNRLTDFELDRNGNILRGIIETKEGIKQKIETALVEGVPRGILTGFETPDGRVYDVKENHATLKEWNFKDGTKVVFGEGKDSEVTITEILFPNDKRLHTIGFDDKKQVTSFTEELDLPNGRKEFKYFNEGRLFKLVTDFDPTTQKGIELYYGHDGLAERIVFRKDPNVPEQAISYARDQNGAIEKITFSGAAEQRAFSRDGTLLNLLTKGVNAEIENEEVARLATRFGTVEAPQFDAQGILTGDVTFVDGSTLTLVDGQLTKAIRPNEMKVNYANGEIESIERGGETYRFLYDRNGEGKMENVKVLVPHEGSTLELPLISFLLDPDQALVGATGAYVSRDDASFQGLIDTSDFRLGGGSKKFEAQGDYIVLPDREDWDFGTQDFTVDFWAKFEDTSKRQGLVSQFEEVAGYSNWIFSYWSVEYGSGSLRYRVNESGSEATVHQAAWTPEADTWYHIALVREGDFHRFFVNGQEVGTPTASRVRARNLNGPLYLGAVGNLPGNVYGFQSAWFQGSLDEVRVSKGAAKWNSVFDPLASYSSVNDQRTKLLLHFDPPNETPSALSQARDEIAEILLPRPLYDSFADRLALESQFETGDVLYFARLFDDPERGTSAELTNPFLPEWIGLWQSVNDGTTAYLPGYIAWNGGLEGEGNMIPPETTDLIDIDGDGFKDRVMVDRTSADFWWVQLNTGQGFGPLIRWEGVERDYDLEAYAWFNMNPAWSDLLFFGALRFYQSGMPHVIGDFMDMNGDGRPDRVMQKFAGSSEWLIQYNNGHGFDPITVWGKLGPEDDRVNPANVFPLVHAFTLPNTYPQIPQEIAAYASEVRVDGPYYEEVADLIDMDGDGLPDRIVRPYAGPFTHWLFQKNLGGAGFGDAVLWEGVDSSFHSDERIGASMGWIDYFDHVMDGDKELYGDLADLVDINGDQLPDRVLLKNQEWWAQLNNGSGFEPAILWDSQVRNVPNNVSATIGTAIRVTKGNWGQDPYDRNPRRYLVDFRDVTGDGLPDRVSLGNDQASPQNTWWVEVSTGKPCGAVLEGECGFRAPEAWSGIYGDRTHETLFGQDHRNFRNMPFNESNGHENITLADLVDMNGDSIPDRVIVPIYLAPDVQTSDWLVQFGTGSGFLPVEELQIESIQAPTNQVRSSRYDYLHVSVKAEERLAASDGYVRVSSLRSSNPSEAEAISNAQIASGTAYPRNDEVVQEWTIENLTTTWQDFYLPIDKGKSNADQVKVTFVPSGTDPQIPIYIDNVTFVATRPPDAKGWLDYLLTDENILSEIHSDRTQTLRQYLGVTEATSPVDFDWQKLLTAETRIHFDKDQVSEFETFYGSVSKVEDGRVVETALPNQGGTIQFDHSDENTVSQTVTRGDSIETIQLSYGRVRRVERPGKSPLEYSYEFVPEGTSAASYGGLPAGTEITVVYDPDTKVKEKYRDQQLISRLEANGIEKRFSYDSDGELIQTDIFYQGRIRQSLYHSLSDSGNQVITTEEGIREEYDSNGTILFHTTPEGYRYAHTFDEKARDVTVETRTETVNLPDGTVFTVQYPIMTLVDNLDGEDIHQVSLISFKTQAGEFAEYASGELRKLSLPDQTQISFDRIETEELFNPETGETTLEVKLLDVLVFHPDGTITEFKDGLPYSITSATGKVINLSTDVIASGAKQSGDCEIASGTSCPRHDDWPLLINPSEAAQFHYGEALKLWNELVHPKWLEFQAPATLPVQIEYTMEGELLTRTFAEGVTELYEEGKIESILARDGEVLIHYSYDPEGNPTQVFMGASRRRLESAIRELEAQVWVENQKALALVAEREEVISQTIEGQYVIARDRILEIRGQIEGERNRVASFHVKGKKGRGILADGLAQIDAALDQVNQALAQLAHDRTNALDMVHEKVMEAKTQIETETKRSLNEIKTETAKAKSSILKEELSPIVYHWYRKLLGRDPSRAEYEAEIQRTDFASGGYDLEGLKADLLSRPEREARRKEVDLIKARVVPRLQSYASNEAERLSFAQAFAMDPEKLVSLTPEEIQSIHTWLDSRSLHFGQSAYRALEALLRDAGIAYNRIDLASDLILIDILTGTITPLEQGDLVISFYAMRQVAAHYGLKLHAAALTYEALKKMFEEACPVPDEPCSFRVDGHIDGNHYIIITGFESKPRTQLVARTDESGRVIYGEDGRPILDEVPVLDESGSLILDEYVQYIDPGAGPEDALDQVRILKEEFLKTWLDPRNPEAGFGYALSPRAPPERLQSSVLSSQLIAESRKLTAEEEMAIRGAYFAFLIPIFLAIVAAVKAAVIAAITAVTGLITGLASGIGTIVSSFGSFFSGLFTGNFLASVQGLFGGILTGLGQIGGAFASAFTTLHAGLLSAIQGIAGSIPLFGPALSTFTATSALSGALKLSLIGLTFQGTGKLLETIGLSPKITQTLISGGKLALGIGLLASGNPLGLGFIGTSAAELLTLHTSLSPTVTNMISIGATALSAFAGGFMDVGTISGAIEGLQSAAPFLAMDLATVGVTAFGESLGLDPRITALIGIPVRASVGAITGNVLGLPGYEDVFDVIKTQTFGGMVSIGTAIGLDAIGVPPIATSFVSNFLGSLAVGLSGIGATPREGEIEAKGENILTKIGEGLRKFGRSFVNVVGSVISFGQKVIQGVGNFTVQGFKKAISAFSSIFSRETQEGIYQDEVGLRGAAITQAGDTWTWQNGSSRIDYSTVTGETIESFGVGGTARITGLNQDETGNIYYEKLAYETAVGGGATLNQTYDNGRLTQWSYSLEGTPILTLKGPEDESPWMTDSGSIERGDIEIRIPGPREEIPNPDPRSLFPLFNSLVFAATIKDGKVESANVELKTPPGNQNSDGQNINATTDLVLLNGFWPGLRGVPRGTVPEYFSNNNPFRNRLNELGLSKDRIKAVALFETGIIGDILSWLDEVVMSTQIKVAFNEIQRQNASKPFVVLANSGGGEPLLNALAELTANAYSVKTAILVGCPVTTRVLTAQSPLERIINVYGRDDYFLPEHLDRNPARFASRLLGIEPPTISRRFFHQGHDFDTINIELKGIGHDDYFYSNSDIAQGNVTALREKSSDFIAVLTKRSIEGADLETFLRNLVNDGQATLTEQTSAIDGRRNRVRTYVIDLEDWSDQ